VRRRRATLSSQRISKAGFPALNTGARRPRLRAVRSAPVGFVRQPSRTPTCTSFFYDSDRRKLRGDLRPWPSLSRGT
jgi:hypothetical protein